MIDPWSHAKEILLLTEAKLRSEAETSFGVTANDKSLKPLPLELQSSVVICEPTKILFHLRHRELHCHTTVPAKDQIVIALRDNLKTEWSKPASVDEKEVNDVLHCTEQVNKNCWYKINRARQLVDKASSNNLQ